MERRRKFLKNLGLVGAATSLAVTANQTHADTETTPATTISLLDPEFNTSPNVVDATGVEDSYSGIQAFIKKVLEKGYTGYIPAGIYRTSKTITIDSHLVSNANVNGYTFIGDGIRRSIIRRTDSGVIMALIDSSAAARGESGFFYPYISGIGVQGHNDTGAILQFGLENVVSREFQKDAINEGYFFMGAFYENAGTSNSRAVDINHVCNCYFNLVANVNGLNSGYAAILIRAMQFSTLLGSAGNCNKSLVIGDGYTYGNTFLNLDLETSNVNISIESPNAINNTFIGGQFNWWSTDGCAIDAYAGKNNLFINPNFAPDTNVENKPIRNSKGIAVIGQDNQYGKLYAPPTNFKAPIGQDTYLEIDVTSNLNSGILLMENGQNKCLINKDNAGNLVFSTFNPTTNSFDTAAYASPNGQFIINNAKSLNFCLGSDKTPVGRQTVTGSTGGNEALANLLKALSNLGLIENQAS